MLVDHVPMTKFALWHGCLGKVFSMKGRKNGNHHKGALRSVAYGGKPCRVIGLEEMGLREKDKLLDFLIIFLSLHRLVSACKNG